MRSRRCSPACSQATRAENAEMAVFAAQMDLALVDLLEGYFERAAQ